MSDQLLPDFDGPRDDPAPAVPKRSRRPTKKKTKRAAPTPKPAKRAPKKRRVRKIGKRPSFVAIGFGAADKHIVSLPLHEVLGICNEITKLLAPLGVEQRHGVLAALKATLE